MNEKIEMVKKLKKLVCESVVNDPNITQIEESYKLGMFNGLEWALSRLEDKEPIFRNLIEMKEYKGE